MPNETPDGALAVAVRALTLTEEHVMDCTAFRIRLEEKLDLDARDRAAIRAEIMKFRTEVSSLIQKGMGALIVLLIAALAYFLVTVGLPGSH